MIKVETIEKSYMTCQSCDSNENLSEIKIGFNERQTSTIRLCRKCLGELISKINPVNVPENLYIRKESEDNKINKHCRDCEFWNRKFYGQNKYCEFISGSSVACMNFKEKDSVKNEISKHLVR